MLIGKWMHAACKKAELRRRREAAGEPITLETEYEPTRQPVAGNRRRQLRKSPWRGVWS